MSIASPGSRRQRPNALSIKKRFQSAWMHLVIGTGLLGFSMMGALPSLAQSSRWYHPIDFPLNQSLEDALVETDLPTGEGGFAKDYGIDLKAGDQVAIEVESDEFDTIVVLIGDDGSTINSNDDSSEGGTNSLLYARIQESGRYIIRVKTFALGGSGRFRLTVNRLVNE